MTLREAIIKNIERVVMPDMKSLGAMNKCIHRIDKETCRFCKNTPWEKIREIKAR